MPVHPYDTIWCSNGVIWNRAQYFSLMIERDLFGTVRFVRNWGYVGTKGREKVEIFSDEIQAAQALEGRAEAQRRKGYTDL